MNLKTKRNRKLRNRAADWSCKTQALNIEGLRARFIVPDVNLVLIAQPVNLDYAQRKKQGTHTDRRIQWIMVRCLSYHEAREVPVLRISWLLLFGSVND